MIRKKYCGTAAKAGGNGENKPHPKIMGVPYLLKKRFVTILAAIGIVGAMAIGAAQAADQQRTRSRDRQRDQSKDGSCVQAQGSEFVNVCEGDRTGQRDQDRNKSRDGSCED